MRTTRKIIFTVAAVALLGLVNRMARADWFPDPPDDPTNHKMHFPQLPDPEGWDVKDESLDILVADDWLCSQNGPVTDIHFWGSWKGGVEGQLESVQLQIWSDDRTGNFSKPGGLLWTRIIDSGVEIVPIESTTWQGWYDPDTGEYIEEDHQRYFQYNIEIPAAEAFVQQEGNIYWLSIWFDTAYDPAVGGWGWKSSKDHFEDNAVWIDPYDIFGPGYQELYEPPVFGQSMDMAFVITPEPATLGVLTLGLIPVLLKRRRSG